MHISAAFCQASLLWLLSAILFFLLLKQKGSNMKIRQSSIFASPHIVAYMPQQLASVTIFWHFVFRHASAQQFHICRYFINSIWLMHTTGWKVKKVIKINLLLFCLAGGFLFVTTKWKDAVAQTSHHILLLIALITPWSSWNWQWNFELNFVNQKQDKSIAQLQLEQDKTNNVRNLVKAFRNNTGKLNIISVVKPGGTTIRNIGLGVGGWGYKLQVCLMSVSRLEFGTKLNLFFL